jgi:hypothetical protein
MTKLRREEVEEGRSQRNSTPHLIHIRHSASILTKKEGAVLAPITITMITVRFMMLLQQRKRI